jgi:hypothetical protein
MRRDYDVFEKFHDGSTLWRACVTGRFEAQRKINELAELSENDFFLIDIAAGLRPPLNLTHASSRPSANRAPRNLI